MSAKIVLNVGKNDHFSDPTHPVPLMTYIGMVPNLLFLFTFSMCSEKCDRLYVCNTILNAQHLARSVHLKNLQFTLHLYVSDPEIFSSRVYPTFVK